MAFEDPADAKKLPPYWAALGSFVHYYSRVESAMKVTLRLVTRTSPATARALFYGVRIRDACEKIRRTREEQGRKIPAYLEEAFSKIAMITTERDRILHYGIEFGDEGDFVSDAFFQIASRVKKTPISVDDLYDLAGDTITVFARLVLYNRSLLRGRAWPKRAPWVEASQRPWRYKPPQPIRGQGKSRGTKPKQSRQRKASPA